MKRLVIFTLLILSVGLTINAQNGHFTLPKEEEEEGSSHRHDDAHETKPKVDTMQLKIESAYYWKINRFGEKTPALRDSARINFHQSSLVDGKDIIVNYLGNIGSPAQTQYFFNRPESSRFIFEDAYQYWRRKPEEHLFLNTKIPYSNLYYQTGGGGETHEELFKATISTNFGKKLNIGFDFDYLYARGFYTNLYNKQLNYDLNASYIDDKYELHAFFANNNFNQSENGGIKDPRYITNPDGEFVKSDANYKGSSLDIPVRIQDKLWNRLRGRHLFVSNKYNIGDNMEEYMSETDSVMRWRKKKDYVYPASIILTSHYQDQRRVITDGGTQNATSNGLDSLYRPYYYEGIENISEEMKSQPLYGGGINDYMSYWSFKNTLSLAMNEGFQPWMKFGLTAFIEYDIRKYLASGPFGTYHTLDNENALFLGGMLTKEKGQHLRYKAQVAKDILNSDYRLEGEIATTLNFRNKDITAKAKAYIKNISPSYFQNNFQSKYWNWKLNLKDTRRVFIGGEIDIPFSKTNISGGVENIENVIYYNKDRILTQAGDVQIVALRVNQKFNTGIFHWDNQIAYQTSTKQEVVALPTISAYTNIYLLTKIAKVLTLQLGVDAHFYTKYYLPGYDPLSLQFYNQREQKLGDFPIATAYANLHLKNTRFFFMWYNAARSVTNGEAFSLYNYPVNPPGMKIGLSWNFNN